MITNFTNRPIRACALTRPAQPHYFGGVGSASARKRIIRCHLKYSFLFTLFIESGILALSQLG
jgi:hypothetical protein